ncbi:MAG: hypothetical protein AAGU26_05885 [bacterium]
MINGLAPTTAREEVIKIVLNTISSEPSSVLIPNNGKANAKTIIEMADAIIEYINSGTIPVSSSGGQVSLTR